MRSGSASVAVVLCGLVSIGTTRHLAVDALCRSRSSVRLAEKVRFGVRHGPSTPDTPSPPPNLHDHKPRLHARGISPGRSFDLEVTRWAPSRLTSCIFHPAHKEACEPLRPTL